MKCFDFSENKAQTSLEALLIIAGAIVIAAAVGLYMKSIPSAVEQQVIDKQDDIVSGFE